MTDQTAHDVTDDDREIARRWAESVDSNPNYWTRPARAAARVILDAVPAPTLADMTKEERRACQWMQADVENRSVRYVIATPDDRDGEATLVSAYGEIEWMSPEHVTPRPDLPRMEWPGDKKPAPAPAPTAPALPDGWRLADHQTLGRVIVTSASTSSDGDGYVYILLPTADPRGYDWMFCPTKRLTYLDQEADQ